MAAIVPALVGIVASTVATKVLAPKPKAQSVNIAPTRIDRSSSIVADTLQRRRGARENKRTGGLGAEAPAASAQKSKLGS